MAGTHSVRVCESPEDIAKTFGVMQELRPHLEAHTYSAWIEQLQKKHEYQLVGVFDEGNNCVSVMGYRPAVLNDGSPCFFVDDLVTKGSERSKGYGANLLDWLKEKATAVTPPLKIALLSGTQRLDAHRFYGKQKMVASSVLMILQREIEADLRDPSLTFGHCATDEAIGATFNLMRRMTMPPEAEDVYVRRVSSAATHGRALLSASRAGSCVAAIGFSAVHLLFQKALAPFVFVDDVATMASAPKAPATLLAHVSEETIKVYPGSKVAVTLPKANERAQATYEGMGFATTAFQFVWDAEAKASEPEAVPAV